MRALVRVSLLAAALAPAPVAQAPGDAGITLYEREVRPLLDANCVRCHGPDKQKSGLRLDSRASILDGGARGAAVVPGDPEASRLIEAVRWGNADLQMPPRSRLDAEQVAILTAWVEAGAPGPAEEVVAEVRKSAFDLEGRRRSQWAFRPVHPTPPPAVRRVDWPARRIDRFVLAKLEAAGLAPAPPADRRTLLRRASFDLIGLPPPPALVEAFVDDMAPDAWPRAVDGLLSSPHFGERWGRHWLDLVRYAESRGHEFDHDLPNAWQYRDYVIRALNADVPYDQLLQEHVAGDLLRAPRVHPETGGNESILGTAFWHFGEEVHSPVDPRGDETNRIDNKIDVFGKTFLGLTVACARCHDHKFDPITAKDYYALSGYLLSSSYRQVRFESMAHNQEVASKLDALAAAHRPGITGAVAAVLRSNMKQVHDYLLGVLDVIRVGPAVAALDAALDATLDAALDATLDATVPPVLDIVVEDFEAERLDGWTMTGTAFGDGAIRAVDLPANVGDVGSLGQGLVHSHAAVRENGHGSDAPTGRLRGPEFAIARDYLHFLVGGGAHRDRTCVDLLIDGAVVRSVVGPRHNRMRHAVMDLREYHGRMARIEMVDEHESGWGNISADHFVLSDNAEAGALEARDRVGVAAAWYRRVEAIAAQRGLDPRRLAHWLQAVRHAAGDPQSPLQPWAHLAQNPAVDPVLYLLEQLGDWRKSGQDFASSRKHGAVVVDYGALQPAQWFQDGSAFGAGPVPAGSVRLGDDPEAPIEAVFSHVAARQDPTWDVLRLAQGTEREQSSIDWVQSGRVLRTHTFELGADRLFVHVQGAGRAVVVVDSHRMIKGPLHGGLVKRWPDTGRWQWIEVDVSDYRGHRAHVEFSPANPGEAGGPLAIERVMQADSAPAVSSWRARLVLKLLAGGYEADLEQLARGYQHVLATAVADFGSAQFGDAPDLADRAWLIDWMVHAPALFGLRDRASRAAIAAFAGDYTRDRKALVASIRTESGTAPVMFDGSGVDEAVLVRGDYRSLGEGAPRRMLQALDLCAEGAPPDGSGRLELARQLTDPRNPLVARVLVNRIWHHLFGRGLVATVDNFGKLGEPPTHPELLDHLAVQLVQGGWSIKRVIREIMLSRTYRMASTPTAPAEAIDPDNRLLHRASVRRLSAESIRDAILAVSGELDDTMFGQSVKVHLTPFMQGRGRPPGGPLDGDGRRSIYLAVRRNFLTPMFLAFDYPLPSTTRGRRDVTNVPAQALALMNGPFVVQQARRWAERVLAVQDRSPEARLDAMYRRAFARPPTPAETRSALGFVGESAGDAELDTWADLCHVLLNLKEFTYLP